uniref:RING-type E3 ubiquitin transferase n=1 Tax=Sinocyclocheilus rhinocerous TaxID=307959 RepID=A0A673N0P4_9TELE
DLTYYVLTTLSALFCGLFRLCYQTLGEVYVSIIQVDPSKRRIPSRMRRSTLIFFHTSVPYLLDKVLICIENELEAEAPQMSRTWMPLSHVRLWIQRASVILSLIFALQQGITLLYRLHVAVFYITGAFTTLAKESTLLVLSASAASESVSR